MKRGDVTPFGLQLRLPGAVGKVRDLEIATPPIVDQPEAEAGEFSLTPPRVGESKASANQAQAVNLSWSSKG